MNYFLPAAKISKDQGKIFRIRDRFVIPMFHPAAALRGTGVMQEFEQTFGKLPKMVERCRKAIKEGPAESAFSGGGKTSLQKGLL